MDFAVKQKSDKLNNLQTELDQLKQTATALQKKVDDFTNATNALIIANQEAETAAQNAKDAQEKLQELDKINENAQSNLASVQKEYNDTIARAQSALKEAKSALDNAQAELTNAQLAEAQANKQNENNYSQTIGDENSSSSNNTNVNVANNNSDSQFVTDNNATNEHQGSILTPTTKTSNADKESKAVRVIRKAYVYTSNHKVAKKNGKKISLKKRSLIKVLDNAKVYRIKGGRFYRIGKNRFVKVGNVEKFTIQINMHATIAGRKNRKVHVSNSNGKHINKYVIAGHNYRFDRKKVIKGEVYYRIANKDQWIKENKLIFRDRKIVCVRMNNSLN